MNLPDNTDCSSNCNNLVFALVRQSTPRFAPGQQRTVTLT